MNWVSVGRAGMPSGPTAHGGARTAPVQGPATAVWSNPSRADILPPVTQASDIAIIGGGIVGLATALSLTERYPRACLVVLDKQPTLAAPELSLWPTGVMR